MSEQSGNSTATAKEQLNNLKWIRPRHLAVMAGIPALAFGLILPAMGDGSPVHAEAAVNASADPASSEDQHPVPAGLFYPANATTYPHFSSPSSTGWGIPSEGLGFPTEVAPDTYPEERDWDAFYKSMKQAQETFRKNGKFLINLYGDYGTPEYLLCDEVYSYEVRPGDALERIGRNAHVHYKYKGQRKYVDESSMARSIDDNNPGKMARMGYELQAGVTLTLPREGSCSTTFDMADEYEY